MWLLRYFMIFPYIISSLMADIDLGRVRLMVHQTVQKCRPAWIQSFAARAQHTMPRSCSQRCQTVWIILDGWRIHGSLNVPIEHHPTIRYMVYNGYYKVMSNIPKMGQFPTPVGEEMGHGNHGSPASLGKVCS